MSESEILKELRVATVNAFKPCLKWWKLYNQK